MRVLKGLIYAGGVLGFATLGLVGCVGASRAEDDAENEQVRIGSGKGDETDEGVYVVGGGGRA